MFFAYAALLLVVLIWGGAFVITSEALKELSPAQLIAARFAVAYAILWLFGVVADLDLRKRFERKDYALLLLLTLVEPVAYLLLETLALKSTLPVNVAIVIALSPLVTTVIAHVFLSERPGRWFYPLLMFSITGVFLVFAGMEDRFVLRFGTGEAFAAAAMILVSFYVLLARPLTLKYSSYRVARFQMGFACIIFLGWIVVRGEVPQISELSRATWIYVLILGVLASAVAYVCLNFVFTHIQARFVGLVGSLIPTVTLLTSVWLLDSRFSGVQLMGVSVALTASALAMWSDKKHAV